MGHKGYFLRLLQLMSYKNKDNDELLSKGQPDPATTEGIYFTHFVPFLPVKHVVYKLSKIAALDCKNHLNIVLKISTFWSLVAQRRSHASGVKGQTRRVTGSGSTLHRITKS